LLAYLYILSYKGKVKVDFIVIYIYTYENKSYQASLFTIIITISIDDDIIDLR